MTCSVGMVKDGGGGLEMFFAPVPKIPTSFTYVFHFTSRVVTLISIDDTSFVKNIVPVPEVHQ